MSNTNHESTASPPEGRLWTVHELVLFFGVKSFSAFTKRHPDFPAALALHTRDRRGRPRDVIAWTGRFAAIRVSTK